MKKYKFYVSVTYTDVVEIVGENQDDAVEKFNESCEEYVNDVINSGKENISYDIEEEK